MSHSVTLFEMGPRDGLQNEATLIPTAGKIELVNKLSECGLPKIEVASFVSPKWVPQMADGAEVLNGISRKPGIAYTALTPNMKGFENALKTNVDEVAVFSAGTETFSQKNINCSIAQSIERFTPLLEAAKSAGIPVRGYISCFVDCPYEGKVEPKAVAEIAQKLLDIGCYEVSLGDTTGQGTPRTITAMLEEMLKNIAPHLLAGHYHDTTGRALENISASLKLGLRTFDSAVGGLGGCPYAPGSKGNVDTALVVSMLEKNGYATGVDLDQLSKAQEFTRQLLA